MTVCNFKLDDVFSDVFGKSASKILDKIVELGSTNFDVTPLVSKKCRTPIQNIKEALDGELTFAQSEKIKLIRNHMESLNSISNSLESTIIGLAQKYQPQINLLLTVPGVSSPLTAIRILAEIGTDMSVFETSKKLCSWAGLTPQNNESANKKKTTRISRAGAYLKPLLVQLSLAACVSNKNPELKEKYQALKKRRGHKKAVIAIARKLLTAIWHILSKNVPYNANLYYKADKPPTNRIISAKQAFAILRNQGYQILEPN